MKTFEVYKGIPYRYIVKKDRYWDISHIESIDEDTFFCVQMEEYSGLPVTTEVNNDNMLVTVGEGYLPSAEWFDGRRGVMAPVGSYLTGINGYHNFITHGNPVVNMETGCVTEFSAANYLTAKVHLPEIFDIYVKFKVEANSTNKIILSNQTKGSSPIRSDSLKLKAWSSSGNGGDFSLTVNKVYWARVQVQGATFNLYGLEDNNYTLDDVRASDDWVLSKTCDSSWMFNLDAVNELNLGRNTSSYTSQFWSGTIELSGTGIYSNNEVVWRPWGAKSFIMQGLLAEGLDDVAEAQTYNMFYKDGRVCLDTEEAREGEVWIGSTTIPAHTVKTLQNVNFTTVGDVVFDDMDAQFNVGAAIVTNKGLPQSGFFATNIRFLAHVKTGSSVNGAQEIFWDNNTHDQGFGIYNGKWRIWNHAAVASGSVAANTSYWVMLLQEADGGSKLYYMVDNGSYSIDTLPDMSAWILGPSIAGSLFNNVGGTVRIGNGYSASGEFWQGTIDITKLRIETADSMAMGWSQWWSPLP